MRLENRGTMVDAVESRLERAILDGVFVAGGLLPGEARLARELGVSRSTLRNALSRLISRGLLEASQGRQSRVSALGRFATLDALIPTVLALPNDGESRKLIGGLLEVRRQLYAALLALACDRSKSLEAIRDACFKLGWETRWEKDSLSAIRRELELLTMAANAAGNRAFLYIFGSLHRLFEQLPAAFVEARVPDAIQRRMLRIAELFESRSSQQLHRFTVEALEVEDRASMAALSTSASAST